MLIVDLYENCKKRFDRDVQNTITSENATILYVIEKIREVVLKKYLLKNSQRKKIGLK